jgi:hypothetical protein
MLFLFTLISLYPVYRMCEDIRVWNKINKIRFQEWCIFWSTFFILFYIRYVFSLIYWLIPILPLSWFLPIYDCFLIISLYFILIYRSSLLFVRKVVLLPLIQEIKRYINNNIDWTFLYELKEIVYPMMFAIYKFVHGNV